MENNGKDLGGGIKALGTPRVTPALHAEVQTQHKREEEESAAAQSCLGDRSSSMKAESTADGWVPGQEDSGQSGQGAQMSQSSQARAKKKRTKKKGGKAPGTPVAKGQADSQSQPLHQVVNPPFGQMHVAPTGSTSKGIPQHARAPTPPPNPKSVQGVVAVKSKSSAPEACHKRGDAADIRQGQKSPELTTGDQAPVEVQANGPIEIVEELLRGNLGLGRYQSSNVGTTEQGVQSDIPDRAVSPGETIRTTGG